MRPYQPSNVRIEFWARESTHTLPGKQQHRVFPISHVLYFWRSCKIKSDEVNKIAKRKHQTHMSLIPPCSEIQTNLKSPNNSLSHLIVVCELFSYIFQNKMGLHTRRQTFPHPYSVFVVHRYRTLSKSLNSFSRKTLKTCFAKFFKK